MTVRREVFVDLFDFKRWRVGSFRRLCRILVVGGPEDAGFTGRRFWVGVVLGTLLAGGRVGAAQVSGSGASASTGSAPIVVSGQTVTVRTQLEEVTAPDPSQQGYVREELLEANPGRPGVPLSIPGLPVETASGGIKAPQYFAPGVAGDHGQPIAQFFEVGGFLLQNNLTANAHGNGYADPNFVIPSVIGGAVVDNAGFNARYGDHSINLAVTYQVRNKLTPSVQVTTDGRDVGVAGAWAPADMAKHEWIAAEALVGNGYWKRPEEREQYKLNGFRKWEVGRHELTAFGVGYYGFSRIPGLVPLDTPVVDDTIDPRQADLTHTTVALLADRWQMAGARVLTSGGFFRTYSLALRSNFGDGLIRQSEFRTVEGGSTDFTTALGERWSVLAGGAVRRDAPRGLDLARADAAGVFQQVTSNDLTIVGLSPYVAVSGRLARGVLLYVGVRRDEMHFDNVDRVNGANSFAEWTGLTSPKVNLTLGRPDARVLPEVAFSFGKAFHANDPRIGIGIESGDRRGELMIQAREFQMVATKVVEGMEVRLTLARVANSAELAKIDPDTGLQQNVGPSVNRYLALAVRRRARWGMWQTSWSQADARDRLAGALVPEAPRMIVDAVGVVNRLPMGLSAQGEYEYVKAKPLGDGFNGVPLQEIRMALSKTFANGRWLVSLHGQLNSGYTGQTTETLAMGQETVATERVVGVSAPSYGGVSVVYSFRR